MSNTIEVDGVVYGEHMIRALTTERDALRGDVERLTRERDAARAEEHLMVECVIGAPHNQAVIATTEHAIAAFVAARMVRGPGTMEGQICREIATDIRAGAWRKP